MTKVQVYQYLEMPASPEKQTAHDNIRAALDKLNQVTGIRTFMPLTEIEARFEIGEHACNPCMPGAPLGGALCAVDARAHEVVREFNVRAARVAHEFTVQQLVQPGVRFRFAPAAAFGDRLRCEGPAEGGADRGDRTRTHREPREAPAEVVAALAGADQIVLGPGSLYTSIMPNLLVDRVAREIEAANAIKIYVCNVMTQPGETDGYTASAHVRALNDGAGARLCDVVIVNDELPRKLLDVYAEEGQLPVTLDEDALRELGTRVVHANVISETDTVRHDPDRLAQVVLGIVNGAVAERASYVKFRAATPTAAAT